MSVRLLIVEDHPETARHLADAFTSEGFDVRVVSTAEHALSVLAMDRFDVVIVDHYLPLRSGLEMLPELHARYPSVPVIFTTAHGHPEIMSAASSAGAFACVEKHLNFVPVLIEKTRDALASCSMRASRVFVRPVFVGRAAEMSELEKAMLDAREGRGSLVFLVGEAGIGKSTIAKQVALRARGLGLLAVSGRCRAVDGAAAYSPWLEIYHLCRAWLEEHAATETSPGERAYLDHLVTQLESTVPQSWDAGLVESSAARLQRFHRIASHFRQLSARQPLLIGLEDLQSMDSASLQLLAFLAECLSDASILILGTFRNQECVDRQATIDELRRLGGECNAYVITVGPFSLEETAEYLERATGWSGTANGASCVFQKTEGHPLFTVEFVKLLAAKGDLGRALESGVVNDLPTTKLGTIDRRLRLLPDAHLQVLRLAALVGRQFNVGILRDAAAGRADPVRAAIDEAIVHGLLVEAEDPDEVRFSHGLVQEELARQLTRAERADAHRRIGEAIERHHADDLQPQLTALARHFLEAGRHADPRRGVEYAIRAADREARLMAYPEAAGLYSAALSADERASVLTSDDRCSVLTKLAETAWRGGDFARARAAGREAVALASSLDAEAAARAALAFAGQLPGYGVVASDPDVVAALRGAIDRMRDKASSLRPLLLVRLAEELTFAVCADDRLQLVEEARRLAAVHGDPKLEAAMLRMGQWTLWLPEGASARREVAERSTALARRAGDTTQQLDGELLCLWSALEHADLTTAERVSRRCSELTRSSGLPYYAWLNTLAEACVALTTSRLGDALELAQRAHQLGQASANPNGALFFGVQWGHLQWLRGDFATVFEWLENIAGLYPSLVTTVRAGQAITLSEWGRLDEARAALVALGDGDLRSLPRNVTWILNAACLAEVAVRTQSKHAAERLYQALRPFAAYQVLLPPVFTFGAVAHHLGNLACALELWSEAERYFQQALAVEAALRSSHWLARTRIEYARMVLSRPDGVGQSEPARLLAEARETGVALSLPSWISRCDEVEAIVARDPTRSSPKHHCRFRRLAPEFLISVDGKEWRFSSIHGLHILHWLLQHPDQHVRAADLVRSRLGRAAVEDDGGGPAIDAQARREAQRVLGELEQKEKELEIELESHRERNDIGWMERTQLALEAVRDDIERLEEYQRDARRSEGTSVGEKCRQNVWHALTKAIEKIGEHFPLLAEHLRRQISRGRTCVYRADPLWIFEFGA